MLLYYIIKITYIILVYIIFFKIYDIEFYYIIYLNASQYIYIH